MKGAHCTFKHQRVSGQAMPFARRRYPGASIARHIGLRRALATALLAPLLVGGSGPAHAQDKGSVNALPAVRAVQAPRKLQPPTADLVIDSVEWSYQPPRDIPGIDDAIAAILTPPPLHAAKAAQKVGGGSGRGEQPIVKVLDSPKLRVTIRNAGAQRWASEGRVVAVIKLGTPAELDSKPTEATKRVGVAVVDAGRSALGNHFRRVTVGTFTGSVDIPGSLGAGETRVLALPVLGTSGDPDARRRLLMAVDKFYTARVDIQAKGDDNVRNNGADLVFRIDVRGQAQEPRLQQRETDPAKRGTVEVVAPPR